MMNFVVNAEYWANPWSDLALGISEETLISSLRKQQNQNFRIWLTMSAMDPIWSKRLNAFRSVCPEVRINEMPKQLEGLWCWLGDDFVVAPDLTKIWSRYKPVCNTQINLCSGYGWADGHWCQVDGVRHVSLCCFVDPSTRSFERVIDYNDSRDWVIVGHAEKPFRPSSIYPRCRRPTWYSVRTASLFANARPATATAAGIALDATRAKMSNSVFVVTTDNSNRRKKRR